MRWEKTRIQLTINGFRARDQEGPGQQHQAAGSPRPHTLFVGGLPASGFSPRLPVRSTSGRTPSSLTRPPRPLGPAATAAPLSPQVAVGSFSGCVRRLRLDGHPLGAPTRVTGVTPCFSRPLEEGLFFADSGGVVTLGL